MACKVVHVAIGRSAFMKNFFMEFRAGFYSKIIYPTGKRAKSE